MVDAAGGLLVGCGWPVRQYPAVQCGCAVQATCRHVGALTPGPLAPTAAWTRIVPHIEGSLCCGAGSTTHITVSDLPLPLVSPPPRPSR